jgi:hypothetical protein
MLLKVLEYLPPIACQFCLVCYINLITVPQTAIGIQQHHSQGQTKRGTMSWNFPIAKSQLFDGWDAKTPPQETQECTAFSASSDVPALQQATVKPITFPSSSKTQNKKQRTVDPGESQKPSQISCKARNDQKWDLYKDEIRRLYMVEQKTLNATMRTMNGYGLQARSVS